MKSIRLWLGLATAVWFAVITLGAPAPAPESQGPISDALRLREKLPKNAPPTGRRVVLSDENTLEVERVTYNYVAEQITENVQKDGQTITVTRLVTRMVPVTYRERVEVKNCKFLTVTKDGKLETIEPNKATALLKKPTTVLCGDSAEVDPRHLELVKTGTLYLVLPPPQPQPLFDKALPDFKDKAKE